MTDFKVGQIVAQVQTATIREVTQFYSKDGNGAPALRIELNDGNDAGALVYVSPDDWQAYDE